jgi:transcriptional regulator with XRE-family HTH domain
MQLSSLIKKQRVSLGLSQLKLSKMLGYPNACFLNNIENNRSKMPRKKLKRLCRALLLDKNVLYSAALTDEANEILKALGVRREI